jgi:hypothetical protein
VKTLVAAVAAVLVLAGAASAAKVDLVASKLTIAAGDLPGSKQRSQGPIHEKGYTSGYQRTFTFAAPNGRSGLVFFHSEALVAQTVAKAASDVSAVRAALSTPVGRAAFIASIAANLKVKPSAVKPGALRSVRLGDSSVELPLDVKLTKTHVYESLVYMQRDRVVSVIVSAAVRPIVAGDSRRLATKALGHVDAALAPVPRAKPTISGDAEVSQVLTATAGTWSDSTVGVAYQWQRCDTSGSSCTNVAGATQSTYTIVQADAGSTLRVEVTATNRFGTAKADSAPTQVVVAPLPPPSPLRSR